MKISKMLKILSVIVILITLTTVITVMQLNNAAKTERLTRERQAIIKACGVTLQETSDYLTEQARLYVITHDKQYYDNYWREVNETKTREKIIEQLKAMNISESDLNYLQNATKESDFLVSVERKAMEMVIPKPVDTATDLMFNKDYLEHKKIINFNTSEFARRINETASKQTETFTKKTDNVFFILFVATATLVLSITVTLSALFQKIHNLSKITEELKNLSSKIGDLTYKLVYDSKDEVAEIGASINIFIDKIRHIVTDLYMITDEVTVATTQLSLNVEETSKSMIEVSKTVNNIADCAVNQATSIESGATSMVELGKIVELARAVINELNAKVYAVESRIELYKHAAINYDNEELNRQVIIKNITDIEGMISDIKDTIYKLNSSALHVEDKKEEMLKVLDNLSSISEENAASTEEVNTIVNNQSTVIQAIATNSDELSDKAVLILRNISSFKF